MKEKLFSKTKNTVPTLLDLCIDSIILSKNKQIFSEILYLPDCILRKVDDRYFKMESTRKYKKRFNQII